MKKIISTFLLLCLFTVSVSAAEFDSSIDANIRKDYNVDKDVLPPLPSTTSAPPSKSSTPISEMPKSSYNATGKTYTVKSGTKVHIASKSAISDWTRKGSKVSFVSQEGFTTKEGVIVPAGTTFRGTITDSHTPQITGNGGLIELTIDEIYFNGVLSNIETKLATANSRKVYRDDIKGDRRYWKNVSKAMTPGKTVFDATRTCASVLYPIPVVNIFSIIPLLGGSVIYVANLTVAPVIAIFAKGGSISLPAGTTFKIQFTGTNQIRG